MGESGVGGGVVFADGVGVLFGWFFFYVDYYLVCRWIFSSKVVYSLS